MKTKIFIRMKNCGLWIKGQILIPYSFVLLSAIPVACTDWGDHYDADTSVMASQQATLWDNIDSNPGLSQFASLVKQTGYDQVLSASQTYTVWAPLNGTFDYEALSADGSDRLLVEFVQNHIARNNYPASGTIAEKIFMLNEKMMNFAGRGSYSIQGIAVEQPNVASSNGVIHTLNGKIPFLQNIYESLNNKIFAIDSVSDYFHSYDTERLNEELSVPGPTLNGEITYLDSIFDKYNELFSRYRSYINREDSNYTMIVPTNEAWRKAKAVISEMYNYVPQFEFMENTSTGSDKKVTTVKLKDAAKLKESIVNMMLVRDLFYNNNLYDNKRLGSLQTGQTLQCDSLCSTTSSKIYTDDAARLLEGASRIDKSNGAVWITDSLCMRTWTSWNPEIVQQAESNSMLANVFNVAGDPRRVYIMPGAQNPAVPGRISGSRYLEAQPSASNTNPEVDFYLSSVRSAEYSVYVVFVPANITNADRETLPHRMIITMGYADEKGKSQEQRMRNPADGTTYFSNDPTRIDTLYLGDFTFPVAYVGTGGSSQEYSPYLRIRSSVTNALSAQYDRTLRIDCIILRPKNLDIYLKENPGYRYDSGDN
jgi:uncharacterized surface protein with fasciclin (FAS1) repeats